MAPCGTGPSRLPGFCGPFPPPLWIRVLAYSVVARCYLSAIGAVKLMRRHSI